MTSRRIYAVQWRDDGLVAVKCGDGRISGYPAPGGMDFGRMGMSIVEYRPWARRLLFSWTKGLLHALEVGSSRNWSPLHGRPVVYLDQNQWSTLSKARLAPYHRPSALGAEAAGAAGSSSYEPSLRSSRALKIPGNGSSARDLRKTADATGKPGMIRVFD